MEASGDSELSSLKPFWCTICSQGFSEAFLLSRHAHKHKQSSKRKARRDDSHESVTKTTRVSSACRACASSKLKCDENAVKCRRCEKKGIPCIRPQEIDSGGSRKRRRIQSADIPGDAGELGLTYPTTLSPPDSSVEVALRPAVSGLSADTPLDLNPQASAGLGVSSPVNGFSFDSLFGDDYNLFYDFLDLGLRSDDGDSVSHVNDLPAEQNATYSHPTNTTSNDGIEHLNTPSEDFRNSWGRWDPGDVDYQTAEQPNLSIPPSAVQKLGYLGRCDPEICGGRITPAIRDSILELILLACDPSDRTSKLSPFPPDYLLERLVSIFLTSHLSRADTWIHIPTFTTSQVIPELLAAAIAAGGSLSLSRSAQAFGFALQEMVAVRLAKMSRKANKWTRKLQYLQAFSLTLYIGLWSGDKRKMEIAGGFVGNLINMLRAGNAFRRATYSNIYPDPADEGADLEKKWRQWVAEESLRRLVYHMYIHCAEQSLVKFMGSPLSNAELSLPLPQSRALWLATSASKWKETFLRLDSDRDARAPSLACLLADVSQIEYLSPMHDRDAARLVAMLAISTLVPQQRLFNTIHSSQERYRMIWDDRKLSDMLRIIRRGFELSGSGQSPTQSLTLEFVSMHNFACIEQIELVAGKEGKEEAHLACELLEKWKDTREARQAMWHAGQVIKHFANLSSECLTEFHAVMMLHAGLCLWIRGMLSQSDGGDNCHQVPGMSSYVGQPYILLDAEESIESQKWIDLGRGQASLRPYLLPGSHSFHPTPITLCMPADIIQTLSRRLRTKFLLRGETLPRLVECIGRAMDVLGQIRLSFT